MPPIEGEFKIGAGFFGKRYPFKCDDKDYITVETDTGRLDVRGEIEGPVLVDNNYSIAKNPVDIRIFKDGKLTLRELRLWPADGIRIPEQGKVEVRGSNFKVSARRTVAKINKAH